MGVDVGVDVGMSVCVCVCMVLLSNSVYGCIQEPMISDFLTMFILFF